MPRRQGAVSSAEREGDKPVAPHNLWERLDAAMQAINPPKPPDAFTAAEYAAQKGISDELARHRLNGAVRDGILERGGKTRQWYRFKEQR